MGMCFFQSVLRVDMQIWAYLEQKEAEISIFGSHAVMTSALEWENVLDACPIFFLEYVALLFLYVIGTRFLEQFKTPSPTLRWKTFLIQISALALAHFMARTVLKYLYRKK